MKDRIERLGGCDDRPVGVPQTDADRGLAAHQDAFEQRLAPEVSTRHQLFPPQSERSGLLDSRVPGRRR